MYLICIPLAAVFYMKFCWLDGCAALQELKLAQSKNHIAHSIHFSVSCAFVNFFHTDWKSEAELILPIRHL
jgi:hypothetical protein